MFLLYNVTYSKNNAIKTPAFGGCFHVKILSKNNNLILAETKGFEPLIPLRVYHISNVAH